ncbi:MAG: hypothetical protein Q4E88_02745 [Coriobacteriia bacterium]|nr:hypothetical protein [Coriobacteriia bacterium]
MATNTYIVDGIKVKLNTAAIVDRDAVKISTKIRRIHAKVREEKIDPESLEMINLEEEVQELNDKYWSFVLGEKEYKRIQDELRKKNDGYLSPEQLETFLQHMVKQVPETKK